MKVLDLYCGDGGCSMGYFRAGYEPTGVDKFAMPGYPFTFIQADALDVLDDLEFCRQFDLIHASPECQEYSVTKSLKKSKYGQDIEAVREKLKLIGVPYVIENVPGAPMQNYVLLCGSMFGLGVIRHRLFECFPEIYFPPFACGCGDGSTNSHRGLSTGGKYVTVAGNNYIAYEGRKAMGIDWMPRRTLSKAIPPAYTQWIGEQMIKHNEATATHFHHPTHRPNLHL